MLPRPRGVAAGATWSVRLLGAIEARDANGQAVRLPSRAASLLLARLLLAPGRLHPREELVELLWPGVDLDVGRNRLRQALSTLKSQLEAGRPEPVILADRLGLRLAAGAVHSDVAEFEQHLRAGDWAQAEATYGGELLPGFYDDWVIDERGRLAALAERLQTMPRVPSSRRPAAQAVAPGGLPSFWTRLFGAEHNATRLRELLRGHRLVTVLGAGGSGKTRLAVEAARALAEPEAWSPPSHDSGSGFDQVVFVSLVDCADAARALDAITGALRLQGRNLLQDIATALAGQRTLLVLDNFEQLAGRMDGPLSQLLLDTATLHLLITSRQRLGLAGEQVFELAGLPVPQSRTRTADAPAALARGPGADEGLGEQPAVALFVDRARAASPDFSAAGQEQAIAALVRLLGGMPLAIELAASRMRGLSPRALLALLTERGAPMLDLLSREGGGADMAQRHASMRHVVDWSWRQLGPAQAELMQALAAFAAPAGAETVAAVAGLAPGTARERLEQLRDHSLAVGHRLPDGGHRYVLLQPVREFVAERTDGPRAAALRERLRLWLIDFGHRCTARAHAAIDEVETEMPLVQAAVLDAVHDGPEAQRQAVRIAVALRRHWEIDTRAGLPMAMVQALDACLAAVDDAGLRSQACALQAYSKILAGMTAEAMTQADEAVQLATDVRQRAQGLLRRVHVAMFSKGDQSQVDAQLAEAVSLAEQVGDRETQALALRLHYLVLGNRDRDRQGAEVLALQTQQLWESLGHRRNAYGALMDRASCWLDLGRLDEAAVALAACERVAGQERFATGTIMSSWMLGRALLRLRQPDAALAAFRRCLDGAWTHKRLAYVADALVQVPGGLAFTGQAEDAARLLGFATAHWQRQFGPFYRGLELDVRPTRRWLRQRLGAVRYETLRLEGACLSLADAVTLGLGRA